MREGGRPVPGRMNVDGVDVFPVAGTAKNTRRLPAQRAPRNIRKSGNVKLFEIRHTDNYMGYKLTSC